MTPNQFDHICRKDFATFVQAAFPVLHHGQPLAMEWPTQALCYEMQQVMEGRGRRLIVNQPPRTLKSMTVAVMFVAWALGRDPSLRIMVVSYAANLANRHSLDCRHLMQSAFYARLFPETRLDKITEDQLATTKRGCRMATTIGGTVTGLGADIIIIDDPMNASDAHSDNEREKVKRFHNTTLSSRLDNPSKGAFVLAMQRLHQDDLTGHLLQQGIWRHLKFQAIATEQRVVQLDDARTHSVRVGDLLSPQRLTKPVLDQQQMLLGSQAFAAQYQQDPVPSTGSMIKRSWLRRYDSLPPRQGRLVVMSLDTATKTDPSHDYSACSVWLKSDGEHHLLDVWRDKVDYPTLKQKILDLWDIHTADLLVVEDHGNGSALLQEFQNSRVTAVGFRSSMAKEARLAAASAMIEAGKVFLPKDAHWLGEFDSELLGFPHVKHDDQVDSLSQYFAWVRDRPQIQFDVFWP